MFWSLFCISFVCFSLIVLVAVFLTVPTFLVGCCLMFIIIAAFIFCWSAFTCLSKKQPNKRITQEIYYKPIKLPEPPTPPKKRKKRK